MSLTPQTQPRRPAGTKDGGQFAPAGKPEDIDTSLSLTRQDAATINEKIQKTLSEAEAIANRKLEKARAYLFMHYPYYGQMLGALRPVWGGTKTLAVDYKGRLYLNSVTLAEMSDEELVAGLAHEVNHLLRGHHDRAGTRHWKKWNIATDMEINSDLRESDFKLPDWVLYPDKINMDGGKLGEEYYSHIPDEMCNQGDEDSDDSQEGEEGDDGEGGGSGSGSNDSDSSDDNSQSGKGKGKKKGKEKSGDQDGEGGDGGGGVMVGDCGSAAGGWGRPSAEQEEAAKNAQEEGLSQDQIDTIQREAARAIAEQAKHDPGTIPGGLVEWAEKINNPTINWRKVFARQLKTVYGRVGTMMAKRTYARPDRRRTRPLERGGSPQIVHQGIKTYSPKVTLVIDTSGSMGRTEISSAVNEAMGIVDTLKTEVDIINCDAISYDTQVIRNRRQKIKLEGGGGTDMGAGIEAAMASPEKPDLIVVLTDGWTPWPDTKPKSEVFVGLIHPRKHAPPNPPKWARTVHIHTDE